MNETHLLTDDFFRDDGVPLHLSLAHLCFQERDSFKLHSLFMGKGWVVRSGSRWVVRF